MIKKSTSIHRIPYFDMMSNVITAVDKDRSEYTDVMCVCGDNCTNNDDRPNQKGMKYQFSYSATPTIEPISYKIKGYKQKASLVFNDIGVDITDSVIEEVADYMEFVKSEYLHDMKIIPLVTDFNRYEQNLYDNQSLSNKIFQKVKRFEFRDEVYDPNEYLDEICMGVNITSNPYIVNGKFSTVRQS